MPAAPGVTGAAAQSWELRSPRALGRWAGVFEALEGFASSFGQVGIMGRLVVPANAAATAANILAHPRLFWLGYSLSVAGVACHMVWIWLFYILFRPVHRGFALLAAAVGVLVCALQALATFLYLAPWFVLHAADAGSALSQAQLQQIAYIFVRLNGQAFNLDLVFFGLWCVLSGYLIARCTFVPRVLGWLLMVDGVGWMFFILPLTAIHLFPAIAVASGAAEIPLQLWLLIRGVDPERWRETFNVSPAPTYAR